MERGIEFQQPISTFAFRVVIAHAASNRLQHLRRSFWRFSRQSPRPLRARFNAPERDLGSLNYPSSGAHSEA